MSTSELQRAFALTRGVLAKVTPDQYGLPTPCASWTVRDLIGHIVGGTSYFAATVSSGTRSDGDDVDFTDLLGCYDRGTAGAVAAFEAAPPDASVDLGFATLAASVFMQIATADNLTHAWDLAKATGQATDLDADLCDTMLDRVSGFLSDALRGEDGQRPFGPKQVAPTGATAAERLAAFMGRAV